MKNRKRAGDAALICVLAAVALAAALFAGIFHGRGGAGNAVEITVEGRTFGTYPLVNDTVIDVEGRLKVVIENGGVSVTDHVCPDGFCEKHRPVSLAGETIICLPQGVVVRITGEGADVVI